MGEAGLERAGSGWRGAARAGLLAAALLLPLAAARADDAPADPVIAQHGAVTMTASQVRQIIADMDPETRQQMQRDPRVLLQRVRDRMVQLVLLDRAKAEKWDEKPDVAYRAEVARDNAIVESFLTAQAPLPPDYPSDKDVAAAYEVNKAKLLVPKQYHLAQIVIGEPEGTGSTGKADAQKRAAQIRKQVTEGHKDFATVATESSDDKQSAQNGGDIGWLRDDSLLPALRQALTGLGPNGVTEPVHTADGWHIIKVLGIKPAGVATLAEAHDALARALRQERSVQLQRRYVGDLLQQDPIHIDQVELWKLTAQ